MQPVPRIIEVSLNIMINAGEIYEALTMFNCFVHSHGGACKEPVNRSTHGLREAIFVVLVSSAEEWMKIVMLTRRRRETLLIPSDGSCPPIPPFLTPINAP